MKDDSQALSLNESINYLIERNPAVITNLKERYPAFALVMQHGMMMGSNTSQSNRAAFVANLLVAALSEAQSDVDEKLKRARQTIARANTYQSWTQYLALLMSGSTLGLIGFEMPVAAQITSVAAVTGSLLGLASERILAVVDPSAGSYRSIFLKLVGLAEKVSALNREALIHINYPGSEEALTALSGQVNSTCLEIKELGAQI